MRQKHVDLSRFLALTALTFVGAGAGALEVDGTLEALASQPGKMGIISGSLGAGTHSSDSCGNDDIVNCIQNSLGVDSREWSYAGGVQSWSIAARLGYRPAQIINASQSGDEWKDALTRAKTIMADRTVNTVFIGLGGNDVCQPFGHDYTGDLQVIAQHIYNTLSYLTSPLNMVFTSERQ